MRVARLAAVAVALLYTIATVAPAIAQTDGYPGSTTTPPPRPERETVNHGQVRPGDTVTTESCGYGVGTPALLTWNDESVGDSEADSNGCHTVTVAFVESAQARRGASCADAVVDGVRVEAKRGNNHLEVAGTGTNGAGRVHVHSFVVVCGDDAGARAERSRETVAGVALPRTGSHVLRWGAVGLLLVAIGATAVVLEKRHLARRVRGS